MVRSGQTGCEGTEWESETSVRCRMGSSSGGTRRVTMTAGERSGSMSEAYSVGAGKMSVMRRDNSAGTGSASVTVHGAGLGLMGLTAMVRSGQTGCEGTEWESETSVRCLVGRSASATQRVVMTVGERSGSISEAYSVDALSVSMAGSSNVVDGGLVTSITVYGGNTTNNGNDAVGADGMRGDGVGVGDVSALSDGKLAFELKTGCHHLRNSCG